MKSFVFFLVVAIGIASVLSAVMAQNNAKDDSNDVMGLMKTLHSVVGKVIASNPELEKIPEELSKIMNN